MELIYHDGQINGIVIAILVFTIIAIVLWLKLKSLAKKKTVQQLSPLERNDVVDRAVRLKQLVFFNGAREFSPCAAHQLYPLSAAFDSDRSLAYVSIKVQSETVKVPLYGHGVKNVKLRLGDSPKDTDYFDKLELTQLAKYFGFVLRRDESAVLRAQYDTHALSLTVKRLRDKLFFIFFAVEDGDLGKEKKMYFYGAFEVEPKARLREKYRWLR